MMVKKSKLYTKTGDKGKTSLLGGSRVSKADARIELYGEIDELNAHLGYLRTLFRSEKFLVQTDFLLQIQNQLFVMGSFFACEETKVAKKFQLAGVGTSEIELLEKNIDLLDEELPLLKNFILAGGDVAATYAHICRTVSRRVERKIAQFIENTAAGDENTSLQLIYVNRLSDYFFALARWINFSLGEKEVLWIHKP